MPVAARNGSPAAGGRPAASRGEGPARGSETTPRGGRRAAPPVGVGPRDVVRIDDLRRAERSIGLIPRCGIGIELGASVDAEPVTRTGGDAVDVQRVVAVAIGAHRNLATVDDEREPGGGGR